MMADIADILERAANLIEPEGAYHDAWGSDNGIAWGDKRAVRWNIVEAIYRVARFASDGDPAISFLRDHNLSNSFHTTLNQKQAVTKLREAAAKARGES